MRPNYKVPPHLFQQAGGVAPSDETRRAGHLTRRRRGALLASSSALGASNQGGTNG